MPDLHSMSRLSLIGLLLLLQTGCSTASLRNLFSWNRRGDYHTLEELEKQSGKKTREPTKTASWNPLRRDSVTAAKPAEKPLADSSGDADPAASKHVGADSVGVAAADPFLKHDAAQPDRTRSTIRRVSAEISSPNVAEVAEPLIVGKPKTAAVGKPSEKPASSSLEARKLAELDALLEGRELASARRLSSEAAVTVGQAVESAKRTRETAEMRARDTVAAAERSVSVARQSAMNTMVQSSVDDAAEDRAEPLIRKRANHSAVATDSPETSEELSADTMIAEATEVDDDAEGTSVAAAEELFGSLRPASGKSAKKPPVKTTEFSWKSSAGPGDGDGNAASANPLKLAGMERELRTTDTFVSPEFDDQPVSDVKHHAPTSGNIIGDFGSSMAGPIDRVPAPLQSPRTVPKQTVDETSAAAEETNIEGSADLPDTSVGMGRTDLLLGLSARSWGLAVAGGIVIALLFLPARRRGALRQTAVGHA
jgi:hypothetical protein